MPLCADASHVSDPDGRMFFTALFYRDVMVSALGRVIVSVYTLPYSSVTFISRVEFGLDAFTLNRCEVSVTVVVPVRF